MLEIKRKMYGDVEITVGVYIPKSIEHLVNLDTGVDENDDDVTG